MATTLERGRSGPGTVSWRKRMAGISLGGTLVKLGIPLAAIGLLIFAVQFVMSSRKTTAAVGPPVAPVRQSTFDNVVAASGIVEPQSEDIDVGSPLPGVVVEVFVTEGQKVRAGDPLFRLDDRQLRADLLVRTAAVESAQAELIRLQKEPRPEEVPASEAQVVEAQATLEDQRDQLQRARELASRNVVSDEELSIRRQAFRVAQSQLARAEAELKLLKAGTWEYAMDVSRANLVQAEAQVQAAQIEVERLTVKALVDAEVLQVNVRPGEFVGAPANDSLVVLGSVDQLHVRVDIDEHDIERFHPGAPAIGTLRGNSEEKFALKFVRVEPYVVPKRSLTGSNTERVDTRVLQAIYSLDPTNKSVYVGQQLEVYVSAEGAAPPQ